MKTYYLKFTLKSDATFGRGDGVAGEVDDEVTHDDWGFPYLGGRAIKGLLVNECAEILEALPDDGRKETWTVAAQRLFGSPGSLAEDQAILSIGDAHLPDDFRAALRQYTLLSIEEAKKAQTDDKDDSHDDFNTVQRSIFRKRILDGLTTVRQQTAMMDSGVPKEHSLRVQRVILRETPFESRLTFLTDPDENDLALLHACIKAFRRAGASRNRGRGLLKASLWDEKHVEVEDRAYYDRLKNSYLKGVQA